MEEKKLKPPSLEEQVRELKQKFLPLLELCIPPEEVRKEIKKNVVTAQISLLRAFKTLLDYEIEALERCIAGEVGEKKGSKGKKRVQKIKVD